MATPENVKTTSEEVNDTNASKTNEEEKMQELENIYETNISLSNFEITKVLSNDTLKKVTVILGKFKDRPEPGLIILEKNSFPKEDVLKTSLFIDDINLTKQYYNDVYGNYECFPTKDCNGIKTSIIFPASQMHIDKFTPKPCFLVEETPDLYKNVTLSVLDSRQFSLQWVYNVLNHEKEVDKIIYEDPDEESGFVVLPDSKWEESVIEAIHVLILPRKKIKSLRELNGSHLSLLKKMKEKGSKIIQEKYKILPSQLRMYLHYQPSFYHLHVHCTFLMQELATGITTEKAHMLTNVISNIEIAPDFYQRATLPFLVYKNDPLFKKYQELNLLPTDDEIENAAKRSDCS